MLQENYTFDELKLSSQLTRDMISEHPAIQPLVNRFYDLDHIDKQITEKEFSSAAREVLVTAIKRQNGDMKMFPAAESNLNLLAEENTYTITAGHQLNLMSGPLYSIYKIAQSVSIANHLSKKYPAYNFVPVFWLATEDHDFEEINHINLFNQKIEWEKSGQENRITGRIEMSDIEEFLLAIESKFQDPTALTLVKQFTALYRDSKNLEEASRKLVNGLFGNTGLLIVDGDDQSLKELFKEVMKREVSEMTAYKTVMETNAYIEEKGYHQQVFVRESNLFYITEDGTRIRIKRDNDSFDINGASKSIEELLAEIESNPERFSPNALYRPLYQETILPNLVFIGGGGEMAYWLQLKSLFDKQGVVFPMLRLRDSILLYQENQKQLLTDLNLELMDLKLGVEQIVKDIALSESQSDLDLSEASSSLKNAKESVLEKVQKVNPGLAGMVEAEFVKMENGLERIESKLVKAEKSKHEQTQKKLVKVRDKFFPNNGFQERYENFLPYYLRDDEFVLKILSTLKAEKLPKIRLVQI